MFLTLAAGLELGWLMGRASIKWKLDTVATVVNSYEDQLAQISHEELARFQAFVKNRIRKLF